MISSGTILLEKNAPHPQCFQLEDDSCPNAWISVRHGLTDHELEKVLSATGWTFFYMANVMRTTAFGLNRFSRFIISASLSCGQGQGPLASKDAASMATTLTLCVGPVSGTKRLVQAGSRPSR